MIKHLLKIVWNRRWTNLRIMIQILLSFLVVFAVVVWAAYYYDYYRQPLGFTYDSVLQISVTPNNDPQQGTPVANNLKNYHKLLAAMREFHEVETAGAIGISPYLPWEWYGNGIDAPWNGRKINFRLNEATDDIKDVLRLKIVSGRWFSKEDDQRTNFAPVVINSFLVREAFDGRDMIGKLLPNSNLRIIGVIQDFRVNGELAKPSGYAFLRFGLYNSPYVGFNANSGHLLARVRPGTPAAFEEKVLNRLKAEARGWWIFDAKPLAEMRESINKPRLIPVVVGGIIAGFLLMMVALGLTGMLWLNVTRRTREIGLRRAKGATRRRIYSQILGELSIITVFGLLVGILVIVQIFPMLRFLNIVNTRVYISSIVISLGFVYALAMLCGLYPSRLASKVNPAEALHYE
jgi:putative ABC transport system permease protein